MGKVWLIGTGLMGIEYVKVLKGLHVDYVVVGRSESGVAKFEKATGETAISGGLEKFLSNSPELPAAVIVAVGVESLSTTTNCLINYGVKKILLEKPGVADPKEIESLIANVDKNQAIVKIAYNRRFYTSVLTAEEIIKNDGGIKSFCFEFTEWSHIIEKLDKPKVCFDNWFLANSTHVLDTAFFLGGKPKEFSAYHSGSLKWHSRSSIFSGAGISDSGALFSYQANWEAPGRWSIEILTTKHRLYFRPMEKLMVQEIGSVIINEVEINDELDKIYKPGFYLQLKAFLEDDYERFCSIHEQKDNINNIYNKISNY